MNRENTETVIWLFCILIFLGLIVKVNIDSLNYSCDRCEVEFFNTMAASEQKLSIGNFSIPELFNEYINEGYCRVTWSPTQGYMTHG